MACRIENLDVESITLDLNYGGRLVLKPGETSRALRDEELYDHPDLADWEADGLIRRWPARMAEVTLAESVKYRRVLRELTRVKGVGEKTAEDLVARGIVSIAAIARTKRADLEALDGVGRASAATILASAKGLSAPKKKLPARKGRKKTTRKAKRPRK